MDAEQLARLVITQYPKDNSIEFEPAKLSDSFHGLTNFLEARQRNLKQPHPVFSQPREDWDKILTTEAFKKVPRDQLD